MRWFDLVSLLVIVVGVPSYLYWIDLPRFRRALRERPQRARRTAYAATCALLVFLTAVACAAWRAGGRGWAALGLRGVHGWRLLPGLALGLLFIVSVGRGVRRLAADPRRRQRLAAVLTQGQRDFLPHTAGDAAWIVPVSLSAGIGEELVYRGYVIGRLAPWLSWWGAAIVSLLAFALSHAYQGRPGIVRAAQVGAVFTLLVALSDSLLPAIALHVAVDVGNLYALWIALRTADADAVAIAAGADALPQT